MEGARPGGKRRDGSRWFATKDPEGNKVNLFSRRSRQAVQAPNAIGHHIIHVGFLVHSRATEDTFYRDLLGFKPYWFGGMVEGKVDWVSQQTPDSHDWLEYMLTSGPSGSGIPADMSQHTLGVLDHFSIGEDSVPAGLQDAWPTATALRASTTTRPRSARTASTSSTSTTPTGYAWK
jgi:catechol 2,3-dioxygenase-like lactoylglutathione lyase family enzyme